MKWVDFFGQFIVLETTTHFWVIIWWSLHMWRGLWDQRLFHLRLLAILLLWWLPLFIASNGVLNHDVIIVISLLCDREVLEWLLNKLVIVVIIV